MLVAQGSDQRNRGLTGQNMRLSHHFGPQGRGKVVYLPHGARCGFPRLQKRGLIEASFSSFSILLRAWFPRLQKRGLIEAPSRGLWRAWALSFHAYKSVAPLKRWPTASSSASSLGFHAYKSVAPLKRIREGAIGRPSLVSTLTKAWPH